MFTGHLKHLSLSYLQATLQFCFCAWGLSVPSSGLIFTLCLSYASTGDCFICSCNKHCAHDKLQLAEPSARQPSCPPPAHHTWPLLTL